jgi:flagellar capping protein FliD
LYSQLSSPVLQHPVEYRLGLRQIDSNTQTEALKDISTLTNNLKGISGIVKPLIDKITAPVSGDLDRIAQTVADQNIALSKQIDIAQTRLAKRRESLERTYSNLEKVVGQLQAMGSSLKGITNGD